MEPRIDFKPPEYVQELPSREEDLSAANQGSLFGRGKNPFFSDRKAMQVNDILTVKIVEQTGRLGPAGTPVFLHKSSMFLMP